MLPAKFYLLSVTKSSILSLPQAKRGFPDGFPRSPARFAPALAAEKHTSVQLGSNRVRSHAAGRVQTPLPAAGSCPPVCPQAGLFVVRLNERRQPELPC